MAYIALNPGFPGRPQMTVYKYRIERQLLVILGRCWGNGKQNGNYHLITFRVEGFRAKIPMPHGAGDQSTVSLGQECGIQRQTVSASKTGLSKVHKNMFFQRNHNLFGTFPFRLPRARLPTNYQESGLGASSSRSAGGKG